MYFDWKKMYLSRGMDILVRLNFKGLYMSYNPEQAAYPAFEHNWHCSLVWIESLMHFCMQIISQ